MSNRLLTATILSIMTFTTVLSCALVNKNRKGPQVASTEEPAQEEITQEVTPEQGPPEGTNVADEVRKLQDTGFPGLVEQRIAEIKKAASEGFRVYTETMTNLTKVMRLADEFEKRGFKVQVRKLNGEVYQLVISW